MIQSNSAGLYTRVGNTVSISGVVLHSVTRSYDPIAGAISSQPIYLNFSGRNFGGGDGVPMAKYTNKTFCRFGADSDTKFKFLGGDGRSVPCIMCTPTYVRGPLSSHSSVLPPIKYGARDPFIELCIGCARAGNNDKDGAEIQNLLFWCFRMIYAMLVSLRRLTRVCARAGRWRKREAHGAANSP